MRIRTPSPTIGGMDLYYYPSVKFPIAASSQLNNGIPPIVPLSLFDVSSFYDLVTFPTILTYLMSSDLFCNVTLLIKNAKIQWTHIAEYSDIELSFFFFVFRFLLFWKIMIYVFCCKKNKK